MAGEKIKIESGTRRVGGKFRPAMAAALALWLLNAAASGQPSNTTPSDRNDVTVSQLAATTFDNKIFDPASVDGKIVVLDFWATWCAPCLAAFPALKALQDRYDGDKFQVISIALYSGDAEQLQWVLDKYELTHTMLMGSSELPDVYGIIGFPTYLLMDRDGKLLRRYVGDFNDPVGRISNDVALLLNGESIAEVSGK